MGKSRFKLGTNMYRMKPIAISTIKTLEAIQKKLQQNEIKSHGRKFHKVTFTFTTKKVNAHLKKLLEDLK